MAISTNEDYQKLAAEINTDPIRYGYAPFVANGNDGAIVDTLKKVRDGKDGFPAITINRPDCTPAEILEAIDIRDFKTPGGNVNATLAASWFESVTQSQRIRLANADGTKTVMRNNIDLLVSNTNFSQTRLDAVAVRAGNRIEELFGVNTNVTGSDVSWALRGTR
jgi:hypothetical protein